MLGVVLTALVAASGAASAYSWYRAAVAEVPAPPETEGVGCLFGGYLIGRNNKGERYDMIETAKQQGEWNKRGALFACAAAAVVVAQQLVVLAQALAPDG